MGLTAMSGDAAQEEAVHSSESQTFGHEHKNAIIEAALKFELSATDTIISSEASKISLQASKEVGESHYKEALSIIINGLKKFPQNFILQTDLAFLLGDCAEVTPPQFIGNDFKDKMINRSKQIFDKLMQECECQPKAELYRFKHGYFYRFRMFHELYELGLARVEDYWGTTKWESIGCGYYSQGVGAARYARKLLEDGKKSLALDYAQKAIVAWAQFFSYKNDYYNAYVHYALALGILGHKDEMTRALTRSASIIKSDLDYFEFKNVIDFVNSTEK